jgi:hypothetical protein
MQKWQVIFNQSDGANFMPSIEKLMYKQQIPACAGMTWLEIGNLIRTHSLQGVDAGQNFLRLNFSGILHFDRFSKLQQFCPLCELMSPQFVVLFQL